MLCRCGCGEDAGTYSLSNTRDRVTRGEPKRFLAGHHQKTRDPGHVVDLQTGCWNWTGHMTPKGYTAVVFYMGRRVSAYVRSYLRSGATIPDGCELDHLCRNPKCVNPSHLEPVIHAVNMRRSPVVTKLTAEAVDRIREYAAEGIHSDAIAETFGITRTHVDYIVKRKVWR